MHLAVSYIDKVLATDYKIEEVTGVACLLLASKFNELDDNIPLIEELKKAHAT